MAQTKAKSSGNPNWVKGGASPNPAGRPAVLRDLRESARGYSTEALETLAKVMRDVTAPPAARVTAARELLDRGFGKAVQAVDVEVKIDVARSYADALMELARRGENKRAVELIELVPVEMETAEVEI